MIAQAIDEIARRSAQAKGPQVLEKFPDATVYAVPNAQGGWDQLSVARQPRRPVVSLSSIEDATAFAAVTADPKTAAWFLGKQGVGLAGDRADKDSCILQVPFQIADWWIYVNSPQWMTHREFVAFARRSLPFLPTPFMAVLKNLKIEKATETESEATASSVAMGNRFKVKASGAGDLPEAIPLSSKPFFNIDCPATVQCVLEIDFGEGKIRLAPIDGEIEGNLAAVHEHIRGEIEGANKDWLVVSGTAS